MISRSLSWLQDVRWWKWIPAGTVGIDHDRLPLTSFPLTHRPDRRHGGAVFGYSPGDPRLGLVCTLPGEGWQAAERNRSDGCLCLVCDRFSCFCFFPDRLVFRNRPLLSQTIRTFIPVGIGLAFYSLLQPGRRISGILRRTMQFIYIGGGLILVWAVAQAVIVFRFNWQYPPVMETILNALVTQSNLTGNPRLAGLTWEASWFAHQLNMLYLPLWLAASYQRTSVFPKVWKISFENVCLVVGMVVFFLTSPRIGGAAFMLMLLYLFLKINLAVYRWIIQRLSSVMGVISTDRVDQNWGRHFGCDRIYFNLCRFQLCRIKGRQRT